jgi:hypothetical protein
MRRWSGSRPLSAFGFSPGGNAAASVIPVLKAQDGAFAATSSGDQGATCARQDEVPPVIIPAHQNGLKSSLTKHHRHRIMDVSGRYVAMLIDLLQSLDQFLLVSVRHSSEMMLERDLYKDCCSFRRPEACKSLNAAVTACSYFGWPGKHEDEAERAVRAGLADIAAMSGLQRTAGEPLIARAGIATGLVVVGDLMGDGASQEQAAVGDTPNLAARLQACAEPGMVVISEATRPPRKNLIKENER